MILLWLQLDLDENKVFSWWVSHFYMYVVSREGEKGREQNENLVEIWGDFCRFEHFAYPSFEREDENVQLHNRSN